MKLISWNVNGLRACCDKGFREIFNELNADFFCLQETKMQEGQLDLASKVIILIGTMPKRKDIREQLFLLVINRCLSAMA